MTPFNRDFAIFCAASEADLGPVPQSELDELQGEHFYISVLSNVINIICKTNTL